MNTCKYLAALPLLFSLAANSSAGIESGIIGGNFSKSFTGEAKLTLEDADTDDTQSLDTHSFSVFIGYQTFRDNRFRVSLEKRQFHLDESDYDEDAKGLRFDWEFVYGSSLVQPFLSLGFGLYQLEDPALFRGTNLDGDSLNGLSFQTSGGIKINFSDSIEGSVSLERQGLAWQPVDIEIGFYEDTAILTYANTSLHAGVQFNF